MDTSTFNDPNATHEFESPLQSPLQSTEQMDGSDFDIEMRSLKSEIKAWEREFSHLHQMKPTKENVLSEPKILELYKRYSRMKAEKKSWTIAAATEVDPTPMESSISRVTSPTQSTAVLSHSNEDTIVSIDDDNTLRSPLKQGAGALQDVNREALFKQKELNRARAFAEAGKVIENNVSNTVSPKKVSLTSSHEPPQPSPFNEVIASSEEFPSLEDVLHPTLYFIHPEPTESSRLSRSSMSHPLPIEEEEEDDDEEEEQRGHKPEVETALKGTRRVDIVSKLDDGELVVDKEKEKEVPCSKDLMNSESDMPLLSSSFLLTPPPPGEIFLCSVERARIASRPTTSFYRFISEKDKYSIASARRELKLSLTPTYYLFDRANAEYSMKESAKWKIKGNFEGSLFKITETRTGDLVGLVHYTSTSIPRAMTVVYITKGSIPSNVEVFLSQSNFMITEVRSVPNIVVLKNRLPKYNADMRTYCLNFNGRVTLPSVKNFQLSIFDESDVQLQFGRVGKDHFSMDVSHPLPLYMAFAICLSSFDAVEKV